MQTVVQHLKTTYIPVPEYIKCHLLITITDSNVKKKKNTREKNRSGVTIKLVLYMLIFLFKSI